MMSCREDARARIQFGLVDYLGLAGAGDIADNAASQRYQHVAALERHGEPVHRVDRPGVEVSQRIAESARRRTEDRDRLRSALAGEKSNGAGGDGTRERAVVPAASAEGG